MGGSGLQHRKCVNKSATSAMAEKEHLIPFGMVSFRASKVNGESSPKQK